MRVILTVLLSSITISLSQDRGNPSPIVTSTEGERETVRKFVDLGPEAHEFRQSVNRSEEYRTNSAVIFPEMWAIPAPGNEEKFNSVQSAAIKFVVWDPLRKRFPGRNHPILEMYRDDKLEEILVLEDVHWMSDIWAATHQGKEFLYVKGRWRFRDANPVYVYEVNREKPGLDLRATFFSKEELEAERNPDANKPSHSSPDRDESK